MKQCRRVPLHIAKPRVRTSLVAAITIFFAWLGGLDAKSPSPSGFDHPDLQKIVLNMEARPTPQYWWERPLSHNPNLKPCIQKISSNSAPNTLHSWAEQWQQECEPKLRKWTWSYWELFRTLNVRMIDTGPSSLARQIEFSKPGLRGLLLLNPKGDSGPRPLVIVRGGIGSDALDFKAERQLLLQLLDLSDFHVLFLGSSFNDANASRFGFQVTGPIAEAEQNAWLIEALSEARLKSELFSSLHFIGISLSGLGSWLAPHFIKTSAKTNLRSLLLMCPYVEPETEFSRVKENKFYHWIVEAWAKDRFKKSLSLFDGQGLRLEWLIKQMTQAQNTPSEYKGDFWSYAKWLRDQPRPFNLPTWFVVSETDPLVPPKTNALSLATRFSNIPVTHLKQGLHCAYLTAYPSEELAHLWIHFIRHSLHSKP